MNRLPQTVTAHRPIWLGIRRGIVKRCPNCGEGHLFRAYLKVAPQCETCGADNTIYPSDDFPPYLTILVAGHLLVPLMFLVERAYEPNLWLQAAFWLPVTALLCLALLPVMKGATVGLCWATGLVRELPQAK